MPSVCLYFHAHQPNRLKKYTFFEIGTDPFYEDDNLNKDLLSKVAHSSYLPANAMFERILKKHDGKFKMSMSVTGVLLEQMEHHRYDVLESFQALNNAGGVEFVAATYYNSLAYYYSKTEFNRQIEKQVDKIDQYFGQRPTVFRNTGLIYFNELAAHMEDLGFKGILAPGLDWHLNGRSPNILYKAPNVQNIKTILSNDDMCANMTLRFTDENWPHYPLSGETAAEWVSKHTDDTVNIFMDYESIGEHISGEEGIFTFFEEFIDACIAKGIEFKTPSQVVEDYDAKGIYDIHHPISWEEKNDMSAWQGNVMQNEALSKIYALEELAVNSKNKDLIHVWSKLQTGDHFYFMSTRAFEDGEHHDFLSPYESPYDGYIYYMNALADLEITCEAEKS